jgi:hypothetical protein
MDSARRFWITILCQDWKFSALQIRSHGLTPPSWDQFSALPPSIWVEPPSNAEPDIRQLVRDADTISNTSSYQFRQVFSSN